MNLYFTKLTIEGDLVCAAHVAAETPADAREWMEDDFFSPVPQSVRDEAPTVAAHIESEQERGREYGVTVETRRSTASMSEAINLSPSRRGN